MLKLLVYDKEVLFFVVDYLCIYMLVFYDFNQCAGTIKKSHDQFNYVVEIWVKVANYFTVKIHRVFTQKVQ